MYKYEILLNNNLYKMSKCLSIFNIFPDHFHDDYKWDPKSSIFRDTLSLALNKSLSLK